MTCEPILDDLRSILDLARWAPSGDNTQPWQFEIIDGSNFVVHGWDTRDWCVYDLDGHASQIAIGALMETISIAASVHGLRADFVRELDALESRPTIHVTLVADPLVSISPLADMIRRRVTHRHALPTTPLDAEQRRALELSVGPDHCVHWMSGAAERWRMAKLLFRSARIRLVIPEAYEVHRRVIEWDADYSEDKIPDRAIGMDPVGLLLMRWAMRNWGRVSFLNRWLAGTWLPRLQLDLVPGYRCAAHALIVSTKPLVDMDDYLRGGRAVQRFWLTATALGLQLQPEMTPLIFARYARKDMAFSVKTEMSEAARRVGDGLTGFFSRQACMDGVFLCRLGRGAPPGARSKRLPLRRLLQAPYIPRDSESSTG